MTNQEATAASERLKESEAEFDRRMVENRHRERIISQGRTEAEDNAAHALAERDYANREVSRLMTKVDDLVTDLTVAREFARDTWKTTRKGPARERALNLFNRLSKSLGLGFTESFEARAGDFIHTVVREAPDFKMTVRNAKPAKPKKGGRR